ncbi:MAG: 6-phosphofructokinase, partial [Firmicutes bacterium]|nr:6-phosphofructokinase [Bacillota bacterium]
IRAAARYALKKDIGVYGIKRGYEGLIDGDLFEMNRSSIGGILHRGGTILETARSERFKEPEGRKKAALICQSFGIDALIVIGGDGSMMGAKLFSKESDIPCMCLPGTIDNDLGYTDYTIGFDTAVNTVVDAVSKIRDTSSSHQRITVVEVMGRHCGDIALYSGLACGAETILVPDEEVNVQDICKRILIAQNAGKKQGIIIKAEGVDYDPYKLAEKIEEVTGVESKVVILSYLQRGGSPTSDDRILATRTAYKAIDLIIEGSDSRAIGVDGDELVHYPLSDALKMKKPFKEEFLKIAMDIS